MKEIKIIDQSNRKINSNYLVKHNILLFQLRFKVPKISKFEL